MTAAVLPLVERRECSDCGAAMASSAKRPGELRCNHCGLRLTLLAPTPPGGWPVYVRNRKLADRGDA